MDVNGISLDSTADRNITGLVNEGLNTSNHQVADKYNAGNQQARGLLNSPSNFNQGLNYGDQVQSDAIKSRYNQAYGRQEQSLTLKNMMNADQDHVKQLQAASQLAGQEVETNKQKALLKNKIEQANKRARGQMLGSILGITGAVGGAYLGGGAGAGAGFQAGAAAGNAIGGT